MSQNINQLTDDARIVEVVLFIENTSLPLERICALTKLNDEDAIDEKLEAKMDVARNVIDASIRARDIAQYKLRWPVSDITVVSEDEEVLKAIEELTDIIKDQSNTKDVSLLAVRLIE